MIKKLGWCAAVLLMILKTGTAQTPQIDSLKKSLAVSTDDSATVFNLLSLSQQYAAVAPDQSINYAFRARDLALKIHLQNGIALAYKYAGIGFYMQGQYLAAIDNYEKSRAVYDSLKDHNGVANILSNEGAVYFNQGDDEKALELFLNSLSLAEKTGDTLRILTALQNIGAIYVHKPSTADKAIPYYLRALPMSQAIKNDDAIGTITVNLGEIYLLKGEDQKALDYFQKSLVAYQGSPNVPYSLNDIGKVYQLKNDFPTAIHYHQQAYQIAEKLNAKVDMAQSLLGLGDCYLEKGVFKKALDYYKKAETISKGISNTNYDLKDTYSGLAIAYSKIKDFKNAFKYQSLYTNIKDSIYNIDVEKKMNGLQFDFDIQKKQNQIDLFKKDMALQEVDLNRQKFAKRASLIGLALVGFIALIMFRNYRSKLKTNKILDTQKEKIETLLLNILPKEVAEELQVTGYATPRFYERASVLFTDFKEFTKLSEHLSPQEVVQELNDYFMAFDDIIEKYHLEKIKTIGDSYMCAGSIPTEDAGHVIHIVRASLEILDFIQSKNEERKLKELPPWIVRIGINTGPLVAGVVGKKKYAYDVWGSTVNIASRMESNGEAGRVNISAATYELIKHQFICTHRGKIFAKNIGEIDMYFVEREIDRVRTAAENQNLLS